MQEISKYIQGLLYFWSFNCSMLGGYLLFVPLIWLQILTSKFHRKILDFVTTSWQYYITSLLLRQNCQVQVTGDPLNSDEVSLIISNHRTRVDWNFLWPVTYHAVQGKNRWWHNTKFVLKKSIKNIPVAGWMMQLAMYIFINRNWEEDKKLLDNYIDYVEEMDYKHILILFPEGTDLTPKTKQSSDRFAEANGLPKYKHVLHPRSTGFVYLVDEMRKKKCLDAVYDVTLIYPDNCPQNEEELFVQGKIPQKVMAHLVRYPVPLLPDTKDELKQFLEKRWLEKEKVIEEFTKSGHFLQHGKILKGDYLTLPWAYFTHFVWMTATAALVYLVSISQVFFLMVICHMVLLYVVPPHVTLYSIRKGLWRLISRRKVTAREKDN